LRYSFEDFVLDTDRRELHRGKEIVVVTPQAFDLLEYLIRNRDRVLSKDDLIAAIWGGRIVSDAAVTTRMNAARNAVRDSGEEQRLIKTLPRKGFRFVGSVREEQAAAQSSAVDAAKPTLPLPDKPSIAVLPFADMSDDHSQEYFADGMAEEIITALSRCGWLFVIARNSSFTYKGKAVDVREVGRALGVRYLLEGSVRKAADSVRIACQLVEAESGRHLWADRYDRALDNIFALQDEIALNVIGAIEPTMSDIEIERVRRKRPDSLDAYDFVLRSMPYVTEVPMPPEALKAIPFLDKALALEPDYPRAHGFLALCHEILFMRAGFDQEHRAFATRHARAAITQGRDDATALAVAAFVLAVLEHDRATAFDALERAIALEPFSSYALGFGSAVSAWAGRAERVVEWAERALRLNPYGQMVHLCYGSLAVAHFQRGRYDESVETARRAIQASPEFSVYHLLLAAPLVKLGRVDEAKAAAARVLQFEPAFSAQKFCVAFGIVPELAEGLSAAWREAGLPP
jgi:TolB-like protein/Tfp pilus assembly protein PilF